MCQTVKLCEVAVREGVDLGGMVNAQLGHVLLRGDHAIIEVSSMGSGVVVSDRALCFEVFSSAFHLLEADGDHLFI